MYGFCDLFCYDFIVILWNAWGFKMYWPGVVAHVCDHSTQKPEIGALPQVQGCPELHSEFKASLNYSETLSQKKKLKVCID